MKVVCDELVIVLFGMFFFLFKVFFIRRSLKVDLLLSFFRSLILRIYVD